MKLEYDIASSEKHCMISFKGCMSDSTAQTIGDCRQAIIGKSLLGFRYVIIDMRDVVEIGGDAIKQLTLLQGTIRTLPAELRVSSLNPHTKNALTKASAVRTTELVTNVLDVPDSWGLSELVLAALLKRQR